MNFRPEQTKHMTNACEIEVNRHIYQYLFLFNKPLDTMLMWENKREAPMRNARACDDRRMDHVLPTQP